MKESFINEYAEIHYDNFCKIIIIKWFPSNEYMSELEFHRLLKKIVDMSRLFEASNLLVDAYDFKCPIMKNTIRLIRNYIAQCPKINVKIVKSRHILGDNAILNLLRDINDTKHNLMLFESRESAKKWLGSF